MQLIPQNFIEGDSLSIYAFLPLLASPKKLIDYKLKS